MKFLSKDAENLPQSMTPPVTMCLFHRCAQHETTPQLDASCLDDAECGACIGEQVWYLNSRVLPDTLDVLAMYLRASSIKTMQIQRLVDRLVVVDPTAGDAATLIEHLTNEFAEWLFKGLSPASPAEGKGQDGIDTARAASGTGEADRPVVSGEPEADPGGGAADDRG